MTTLELEPRTDVAKAASTALDLEKLDLTTIALAQFGDWRAAVAATKANLSTVVLDLSTDAKCKEARSLRQRLIGDPLAQARKVSKGVKSKMAKTSDAMGKELEKIEADYEAADALILPKIVAREGELEAEREKARQAEAARKAKHEAGIATIRAYLSRCQEPGMTSLRVANGIHHLQSQTFGPEWEEYAVPAANAQCETLQAMRVLQAQLQSREQEAERQELIRLENERQAEANRIEAKRIADEAAEIRRQAAELAAQRDEAQRRQAINERIGDEFAKAAAPGFKPLKALPEGVTAGAPINETGQWYSASGLLMNEDGTRSIFCDVDEDPEPTVTVEQAHMLQDTSRELSQALASKPDAMLHAREAAAAIAAETPPPPPLDEPPATMTVAEINRRLSPLLKTDSIALEQAGFRREPKPGSPGIHFRSSDWELMRAKFIKHVQGLM